MEAVRSGQGASSLALQKRCGTGPRRDYRMIEQGIEHDPHSFPPMEIPAELITQGEIHETYPVFALARRRLRNRLRTDLSRQPQLQPVRAAVDVQSTRRRKPVRLQERQQPLWRVRQPLLQPQRK